MDSNRVVALGTVVLALVGIVSAWAAIRGVHLLAQQLEQQSRLARHEADRARVAAGGCQRVGT
jgi:hypothetical protein